MLLLVGLGNPGDKYAGNRHNVGFMAVDEIVRRHNFSSKRSRFQAHIYEGMLGGQKVVILKPTTYMNNSGNSVQQAMRFYKLESEDVVVIYDEIDLTPGMMKTKLGGGAAGHNGIRSISEQIGPEFHRVRIGIGRPGSQKLVHNHVLGDFYKMELEWLEPLLESLAEEANWLGMTDLVRFKNEVSRRMNPNQHSADTQSATKKVKDVKDVGKVKKVKKVEAPKLASTKSIRESIVPSGPMAEQLMKFLKAHKKTRGDK